jgi:hypothetical protein
MAHAAWWWCRYAHPDTGAPSRPAQAIAIAAAQRADLLARLATRRWPETCHPR